MDTHRLQAIEKYVINFFQEQGQSRILAKDLLDSTSAYANADIVRALEDLEKKERLLVRHTTEGNDYISLTPQGVVLLGIQDDDIESEATALPLSLIHISEPTRH